MNRTVINVKNKTKLLFICTFFTLPFSFSFPLSFPLFSVMPSAICYLFYARQKSFVFHMYLTDACPYRVNQTSKYRVSSPHNDITLPVLTPINLISLHRNHTVIAIQIYPSTHASINHLNLLLLHSRCIRPLRIRHTIRSLRFVGQCLFSLY